MSRLLLAILLAVVCLPAFAAQTLSDVVQRYRTLKLGEAKSVSNVDFTIGHARFAVPSGVAAPVMAGDEQVGVYFKAAGTFTYETTNKDEFAVVRYNAKTNGVQIQASPEKLTFQEPFKELFLWGNPLPALNGSPATIAASEFEQHRESFQRQVTGHPAEHLFVMRTLDAPNARALRAEIAGDREQLVYIFDEAYSKAETLQRLYKINFQTGKMKGALLSTDLSAQGVGRSAREESAPHFMITNVDIDLTASEKTDAVLICNETIVPQRPLNVLRFDLYSDYTFSVDHEPRHFNISSVKDEKGNALPYSHRAGELLVGLPSTAAAGKELKLRFEIDGNFLYRPSGDNYWELGIEPWFPQGELNEMAYTYHGVIKVKKPFVPFSPGKTIRRETEGDYNVVETSIDQPVTFVAILAGKYHSEEFEKNGLKVRVATYAGKNTQAAKQLANIVFAAIEYYPTFLGPFPFTEFNIIEKNELGYGQAPPATMFITREAFTPKHDDANEIVQGVNLRIAHEVAHQYWGIVVKMPSMEEQWITESFADYSAALFMKAAGRKIDWDRSFINWRTEARQATQSSSIPTANRMSNPGDFLTLISTRQGLIYHKGAYLLAALHQELGDQAFLTFLKSYQRSFRWKFGTTEDVVGLLSFMTKKDYAGFFDQYYYGTALPEVKR